MKNRMRSGLLGALLTSSCSAMAAGFVALPTEGFDLGNGNFSAYTLCNLTGAFGADEDGSIPPTFSPNGGANNTCAIPAIPTGYKQIKSTVRPMVLTTLNSQFRPVKVTVGQVTDRVWVNDSEASCIFGTKVRLSNADADKIKKGKQYFEVNDILRGGFKGAQPEIAYWFAGSADEVLYRAGLTDTSLVFEPEAESDAQPPLDDAEIDENWVDFSTDLNYRDDDGSSYRDSPWMLVKTACQANEQPVVLEGVLKFRQMGQEGQPYQEVAVKGYALKNAMVTGDSD